MKQWMIALRMLGLAVLVLGLGYPFFWIAVGHVALPEKAKGSLLYKGKQVVGSSLLAEPFVSSRYVHGRPSACNALATPSWGSNLGPLSQSLRKEQAVRDTQWTMGNGRAPIPAEMRTASASGLDPHITVEAALAQLPRVVKNRGWSLGQQEAAIRCVHRLTERSFLRDGVGIVHVLLLNSALDQL